jgi:hypothetical protein
MLELLRKTSPGEIVDAAGEMIALGDFYAAFKILNECRSTLALPPDSVWTLYKRARSVHGALADALPPVFKVMARNERLIGSRLAVQDPELRMFLGFVLNAHTAEAVRDLVATNFPNRDVSELLVRWLRQLAELDPGSSGSYSVRSALGLPTLDAVGLEVLRGALRGEGVALIARSLVAKGLAATEKQIDDVLAALGASPCISALLPVRSAGMAPTTQPTPRDDAPKAGNGRLLA